MKVLKKTARGIFFNLQRTKNTKAAKSQKSSTNAFNCLAQLQSSYFLKHLPGINSPSVFFINGVAVTSFNRSFLSYNLSGLL